MPPTRPDLSMCWCELRNPIDLHRDRSGRAGRTRGAIRLLLKVQSHGNAWDGTRFGDCAPGVTVDGEDDLAWRPHHPPGVPLGEIDRDLVRDLLVVRVVVHERISLMRPSGGLVEVDLRRPHVLRRPQHLVVVDTATGDLRADEVGAVGLSDRAFAHSTGRPIA